MKENAVKISMPKAARRKALDAYSGATFSYLSGSLLCWVLCFCIYSVFYTLYSFFLIYSIDISVPLLFFGAFYVFCEADALRRFCICKKASGISMFVLFFKPFRRDTARRFMLLLCFAGFFLIIFGFTVQFPYLQRLDSRGIMVFEIFSLFEALGFGFYAFCFIVTGRLQKKYSFVSLLFILHIFLSVLSYGLYLVFFVPYLLLTDSFMDDSRS